MSFDIRLMMYNNQIFYSAKESCSLPNYSGRKVLTLGGITVKE